MILSRLQMQESWLTSIRQCSGKRCISGFWKTARRERKKESTHSNNGTESRRKKTGCDEKRKGDSFIQ